MKKNLTLILAILAFAALLASSDASTAACRNGIRLCIELIIPSLFPFFVLSVLLNKLGLPSYIGSLLAPAALRLYGVSGAGASALVIGLLGGYPLGAAYIAEMRRSGAVGRSEAERLLAFCNNSGPAFIIGAVGLGVFGSVRLGLALYFVHIFSALVTGLFFRSKACSRELQPEIIDTVSLSAALPQAVRQSVVSLAYVCGFVVFFSVILGILDCGGSLSLLCGFLSSRLGCELHYSRAMLTGLLELGSAVGAMHGLSPSAEVFSLAAFILGWGGLSVHMQTAAVLSGTNIKGALHFAGRLISASIAAGLAALVYIFIS